MLLWGPFFLAKALRRQEFTGLAPLRPSRLCERVPARRVAAIFRAEAAESAEKKGTVGQDNRMDRMVRKILFIPSHVPLRSLRTTP